MVVVVGATGLVGGEVARTLVAQGERVRAVARTTSDASKVAALEEAGVDVVRGDLRDPASLAAACDGADAVISTVSAMPFSWEQGNTIGDVDRDGQIALVDAARTAGVRQFVLISFPHAQESSFPLADAKLAAETHLKSSGLDYTILIANLFMEVWLSPSFGFDYAERKATIFGDGSNQPSWVSHRDVARTAVAALSDSRARNAELLVGGPQALSPGEVIAAFEKAGVGPWQVENVPVDALQEQFAAATDEVQKSVTGLQLGYATANLAMDPGTYLVADGLKTVEDYARSIAR